MTDAALVALGVAAACALVDWWAVVTDKWRAEYVFKPATILALIVVALALEPEIDGRRIAVVLALVLSLAGDVLLMIRWGRVENEGLTSVQKGYFVPGLVGFLLAHIAYIVAFQIGDPKLLPAAIAFLAIRVATLPITARLTKTLRDAGDGGMAAPVRAYALVISGMVGAAIATGDPVAIAGAVLFLASDFLIAWSRFVVHLKWAPLTIIVTYHVGQAGLVLSLV